MQCINEVPKGSHVLIMTCRSVQSDLLPVTKSAIRMDILQSRWTFEALPCGKTRIRTEMLIEEKFAIGVPSVLITFVQNTALKESVVQFAKAVRRSWLAGSSKQKQAVTAKATVPTQVATATLREPPVSPLPLEECTPRGKGLAEKPVASWRPEAARAAG